MAVVNSTACKAPVISPSSEYQHLVFTSRMTSLLHKKCRVKNLKATGKE